MHAEYQSAVGFERKKIYSCCSAPLKKKDEINVSQKTVKVRTLPKALTFKYEFSAILFIYDDDEN